MAAASRAASLRTLLVVLVSTALAGVPSAAHAATIITVTSELDELEPNGVCSLREAIQAANTDSAVDACPAGSGADTIVLDREWYRVGGTDPRTQQPLVITSDLTLQGTGDTSLGSYPSFGTINVQRGSVTIAMLSIRGGQAPEGGAIRNAATLTVQASELSGEGCFGGAVFNDTAGRLTITDSVVSDNRVQSCRAAAGAGIYNRGTLTLSNTLIRDNRLILWPPPVDAQFQSKGGGIYNAGTATLDFVSVLDNLAVEGDGGGIWNTGTLRISNSMLARNRSSESGQDCAGTLDSGGHNLIEQLAGCTLRGPGAGDLLGRDAKLPPRYDDYLPPPWLFALDSPAIDAADAASCPATDVWGTPRPVDGNADGSAACDIGAYELPPDHRRVWLPTISMARR